MRLQIRKVDKESFHLIRVGDENDGQNHWQINLKDFAKCLEQIEGLLREAHEEPESEEKPVDES